MTVLWLHYLKYFHLHSPVTSILFYCFLLLKKCIPTWYSITYLFAYDLAPKLQPELHKSKDFSALCYVLRRTQSFLRRGTKNLQSERSTHDGFYRKTPLLSLQISYHMIPMDLGRKDHIKHQEADISLHTCYLWLNRGNKNLLSSHDLGCGTGACLKTKLPLYN